jgi:hypothetical protein
MDVPDKIEFQKSPTKINISKQIKQESIIPPTIVPDSANISCFPDSLAKASPEEPAESEDKSVTTIQHAKRVIEKLETHQNRVDTDSL